MGGFPLPPFALTGGLAAGGTVGGGNGWNQGSWTVNVAGSGTANQSATAATGALAGSPLLVIALALGAYLLLRQK